MWGAGGGGGVREKLKCVWGGGSKIFSSPSPPEDFKWNSPDWRKAPIDRYLA